MCSDVQECLRVRRSRVLSRLWAKFRLGFGRRKKFHQNDALFAVKDRTSDVAGMAETFAVNDVLCRDMLPGTR